VLVHNGSDKIRCDLMNEFSSIKKHRYETEN